MEITVLLHAYVTAGVEARIVCGRPVSEVAMALGNVGVTCIDCKRYASLGGYVLY